MRSVITTFALATAVASALLVPGTAMGASTPGGDQRPREEDWAELHGLTDHSRECVDNAYVKGCVQPYGDILWLRDDEWDGIDVRLWWVDNNGGSDPRHGFCQSAQGYGDWARCDKDLPEGHEIKWATSWYADGEWRMSAYQYTRV